MKSRRSFTAVAILVDYNLYFTHGYTIQRHSQVGSDGLDEPPFSEAEKFKIKIIPNLQPWLTLCGSHC